MSTVTSIETKQDIYSRSFSFKTWGSLSEDIEDTLDMLRSRGFIVRCTTRVIGERGFIFKKTVFAKDIIISVNNTPKNKAIVDLICRILSESYDHYSEIM